MTTDYSTHAKLLLVDDQPDSLISLIGLLHDKGYEVFTAIDGVQGYARAVALQPDLILLDVNMPKMDGFALARLLKSEPATSGIPIIFLSIAASSRDRLRGLRAGAVDYIVKPFHHDEVVERVRIHIGLADQAKAGARPEDEAALVAASSGPALPADTDADAAGAVPRETAALFKAATELISGRLSEAFTVKRLAEKLGVPERRIMLAFEACLGMTLFEYLRGERMQWAKHLLSNTSLSIADIAHETGYSTAANFSTAFREYAGMAPSVYRKSH